MVHSQKLPQVIPSSPTTASLGKYGEIPIGLFTGSPQISIPLYEYKTRNISLPITLRYSSNGIRVDEYSSNVGMGWDLIAGGMVTRRVNDDPDENTQAIMPDVETELITFQMLGFLEQQTNENGQLDSSDYQPDSYSFNFNGYSGSFYLEQNNTDISLRNVVLFEPSPLKIEIIGGNRYLDGFIITDPHGIEYEFGGGDAIEKSMSRSSCTEIPNGTDLSYKVANAWYLKKILHPNGDHIDFEYITKFATYDNGVSQSVTRIDSFQSGCGSSPDTPCLNSSSNIIPYLTEISGSGLGKVTFTYSQKTGMPTGMDKLDQVTIVDKNSNLIKEYSLEYLQYTNTNGSDLGFHGSLIQDYHAKRIFLDKLTEKSRTGALKPSHKFQYYDPQKLPSRFTGSQDFWGYYNGKFNLNLIDTRTIEYASGNGVLANELSNFNAADRSPDSFYGISGLLKKIIYPTGGSNTMNYEGHSYLGTETIYSPFNTLTASVYNQYQGTTFDSFTTPVISHDHDAHIDFLIDMNEVLGGIDDDGLTGDPDDPYQFLVTIEDLTTGQLANLFERIAAPPFELQLLNPFTANLGNATKDYFVRLLAGHSYKVTIAINRVDTLGTTQLYYYPTAPTTVPANIEVGGLRVSKVITDDGKGHIQTKNYHYANLNDLGASTGKVVNRNSDPYITKFEARASDGFGGSSPCTTSTLSSNSAYPIYGKYHIGYGSVIEEYGNNFSGGGRQNVFQTSYSGSVPNPSLGRNIPGTPLPNFFGFGRELEKNTFKKEGEQFITLNKIKIEYHHDDRLDKEILAYNVRRNAVPVETNLSTDIGKFDITQFSMNSQWYYPDKRIETQYDEDGLNPVATTTDYFYDNTQHLQITRSKVTNSTGEVIETKNYYASEMNDAILENKHRIAEVVRTELFRDNVQISTQENEYAGNRHLTSVIKTSKTNGPEEERIKFHSYYSNGNIKEVSKKEGTRIIYLWGYNSTLPIAKLENASFTSISSTQQTALDNAVTASDADIDSTTENILRDRLNDIRDEFPNAMVTTYTYDPMIGVTSTTDSREYTTRYYYDEFNRLEKVKDSDNKLVQDYLYQYRD